MSIDRVGSPQAVSAELDHGPRLDRRRLVQGAVAVSLAGAAGGVGARVTGAASDTEYLDAFCGPAASQVSTGGMPAANCLEASLHVMMR